MADSPDTKRTRLNTKDSGDSIESRILAGSYSSLDSLTKDVKIVQAAILEQISSAVNGDEQNRTSHHPDTKDKLSNLVQLLEIFTQQPSKLVNGKAAETAEDELSNQDNSTGRNGQILSLRTQINGRPHFLYSGLASDQKAESSSLETDPEIKDTGLPNGLEVTDFAFLNAPRTSRKAVKRTIGEVFRSNPIGNMSRKLDPPKATGLRTNTLRFSTRPRYWDQNPNPGDYKDTKLETGSWLSYGSNTSISQSHTAGGDLQQTANVIQNEPLWTPSGTDDLFTSAYSSFAPISDNSLSVPSSQERGQAWWRQNGNERLSTVFSTDQVPGQSEREASEKADDCSDVDEFADLVADFTSMEDEDLAETREEASDIDTVLRELSELIEILASHHKVRALNPPSSLSSPTEPSEVEIGVYEMLRGQLSILVGTLPPYAVAKLNGDQLEELNISTKLLVEVPAYTGTGQVDDYVLKRQRASLAATSAVSRSGAASQPRPGYAQGQTATSPYNGQARNFNSSIAAGAGYGPRNTTSYQTPTAPRPAFNQTPYQAQTVPISNRPTIQQFQRPIQQNGYVSNANGPPSSYAQAQTTGFAQRPSQPGYQQRAQHSAIASAGRSASPQKPLTNGQIYPARGPPSNQYLFPRQASGTPSTPAGVAQARYDGATEASNTDASGRNVAKTPQQSLSPGINLSQTVEVSR